jgi:hypothetical protein
VRISLRAATADRGRGWNHARYESRTSAAACRACCVHGGRRRYGFRWTENLPDQAAHEAGGLGRRRRNDCLCGVGYAPAGQTSHVLRDVARWRRSNDRRRGQSQLRISVRRTFRRRHRRRHHRHTRHLQGRTRKFATDCAGRGSDYTGVENRGGSTSVAGHARRGCDDVRGERWSYERAIP